MDTKLIKPVILNGVQYTASKKPGFIDAKDARSGKRLWDLKIALTEYGPLMEKQSIAAKKIQSISLQGNALIVNNAFLVDVSSKRVLKITK